KLQRFQLHAERAGRVGEGDRAEVGLAGLGTKTGELGADNFDGVVASGLRVGESLQLLDGRGGIGGHDSLPRKNPFENKDPAGSCDSAGFILSSQREAKARMRT